MSRMVGGTFGVAAMGALVSGLGRDKLDELLPQLSAGRREALAENLGQAQATAAAARSAMRCTRRSSSLSTTGCASRR
jgi:hypothetical protein